jgi:ribonuclease R
MHGDTVKVKRGLAVAPRPGGRGRKASLLRRNPRVAGVLRRRGKSAWLEPDDSARARADRARQRESGQKSRTATRPIVDDHAVPGHSRRRTRRAELIAWCSARRAIRKVETVAKILMREGISEEHHADRGRP